MLRCCVGLGLLLAACSSARPVALASGEAVRLASDLVVRRLAEHVYVVTHEKPWPANSVVVEARDGTLVLVGSPYTTEATERVLAWLGERFGTRKRVAIDTHFHDDAGIGGNLAFHGAGIPIYGSALTVRLLSERRQEPGVPPDHVFELEQGLELPLGEPVRVVFPGPGHTADNVVVFFPQKRLMVGGCLIKAGSTIGNVADADLAHWAASVRKLDGYDFDVLVPGHGERFDRGMLEKHDPFDRDRRRQVGLVTHCHFDDFNRAPH